MDEKKNIILIVSEGRDYQNLYNIVEDPIHQAMLAGYTARPSLFGVMLQLLALSCARTRMFFQFIKKFGQL